MREQALHGEIKLGYVMVNGGLDDGMRSVEVAMGEPIAHAGDLLPRKVRFRRQQRWTQSLHGLTDLSQSQTNSIEDQSITEAASFLILTNGLNGIDDVGQPIRGRDGSQEDRFFLCLGTHRWSETLRRHDIDGDTKDITDFPLQSSQRDQT